uniref:Uncharacterized protein n=1 Tax=Knipowitschia caucasica TaxID=637954 RepID=A0AAV2J4C2_KNICA
MLPAYNPNSPLRASAPLSPLAPPSRNPPVDYVFSMTLPPIRWQRALKDTAQPGSCRARVRDESESGTQGPANTLRLLSQAARAWCSVPVTHLFT